MVSSRKHNIFVPLWRPLAQCCLDAFLGVLLGLAFIFEKTALRSPAYGPLRPLGHVFVGLLLLLPGVITCTLLLGGHRKNSFIPLLFLSGVYAMFTMLLAIFSITHPAGWGGDALFAIFTGSTLVAAFTAADLP